MRKKCHIRLPGGDAIRTSGGFKANSLGLRDGGKHFRQSEQQALSSKGQLECQVLVRTERLPRRKSSLSPTFPHHSNELTLQCL